MGSSAGHIKRAIPHNEVMKMKRLFSRAKLLLIGSVFAGGIFVAVGPACATEDFGYGARFATMLNKPGDLETDDLLFLNDHPATLGAWAEATLKTLPLVGPAGEIPNPRIVRLLQMLQHGDPERADRLGGRMIAGLAEMLKEVRCRRGETLTKAFIASTDPALEKAGVQAAAKQYPDVLIRAIEMGVVNDITFAIKELGRNKTSEAAPALRKIADTTSNDELRAIARTALANIRESVPDERLVKSSPILTARSYVEHVRSNPDWFTDNELEFTLNPIIRESHDAQLNWEGFVADGKGTPDGRRELAKRNDLADAFERALKRPDRTFIIVKDRCHVALDGKVVTTLYRDMLGRWRLHRNP